MASPSWPQKRALARAVPNQDCYGLDLNEISLRSSRGPKPLNLQLHLNAMSLSFSCKTAVTWLIICVRSFLWCSKKSLSIRQFFKVLHQTSTTTVATVSTILFVITPDDLPPLWKLSETLRESVMQKSLAHGIPDCGMSDVTCRMCLMPNFTNKHQIWYNNAVFHCFHYHLICFVILN